MQYIISNNTGCSDTSNKSFTSFPGRSINLLPTISNSHLAANFECTDSYGWTNYYYDPGTPDIIVDDTLLLSIKKNGNDIGQIGNGIFSVEAAATQNAGSNTGILLTNRLITNPSGFWVMNRYWKVVPTTQPTSPVYVRFYFNTQDLNDVNGSFPSHNLIYTDLLFYKSIGGNPDPSTNLTGAQRIISIANGSIADTTHWLYEDLQNNRHAAEFQVANFSGGGGGATVNGYLLPLQLTSFKASEQQRKVAVTWTTSKESNIDGYELSVSADAQNYTLLFQTNPNLNNDEKNHYAFSYKESNLDKAYYKLRIVEKNGTIVSSAVAIIEFEKSQQNFRMFPNPAYNFVTIENVTNANVSSVVSIYNSIGIKISQQKITGRLSRLDISMLHSGNYKLAINNNKKIEYKSLSILK